MKKTIINKRKALHSPESDTKETRQHQRCFSSNVPILLMSDANPPDMMSEASLVDLSEKLFTLLPRIESAVSKAVNDIIEPRKLCRS